MALKTETQPYEETVTEEKKTETTADEIKQKQNELNEAEGGGAGQQNEPVNNDIIDDGEISLLSDLKRKTDKDLEKEKETVTVNEKGEKIITNGSNVNTPTRTKINYQNHELVARLTVACLSVGMTLLLQYISDDWTEEAAKKYKLSNSQKDDILEPLTLVLEQSKSKYNPVIILVVTVCIIYVPQIAAAWRIRKEKKALPKKKKLTSKNMDDAEEEENETQLDKKKNEAKEIIKTKEVFVLTQGQKTRLNKIKSKRGKRSNDDIQFIKDLGLEGLV